MAPSKPSEIKVLHEKYSSKDEFGNWTMEEEGMNRFYTDIGIEDANSEAVVYLISKYMNDTWSGYFTLEQFTAGCTALNADTIDKWTQVLNERLYPELDDESKMKQLY